MKQLEQKIQQACDLQKQMAGTTPKMDEKILEAATVSLTESAPPAKPKRSVFMKTSIAKMAIAAVLMMGLLAGMLWLIAHVNDPVQEIVKSPKEQQIQPEIEKPDITDPDSLQKEMTAIAKMHELQDIEGLAVALKGSEYDTVKTAIANYLAKIGDESVIPALQILADQWTGDPEANPYQKAIDAIRERIEKTEELESDVPEVEEVKPAQKTEPVVQTEKPHRVIRHPNWPGLDEPVMHCHSVFTKEYQNGQVTKSESWISLPRKIRDEEYFEGQILIDNGIRRLTLNMETKEAQLEDSWTAQDPPIWQYSQELATHPSLEYSMHFRDSNSRKGIMITLLKDQSTEQVLVCDVKDTRVSNHESMQARFQVDARTMLPERLDVQILGDPNEFGGIVTGTMLFDYSPIDDSVYDLKIPPEYNKPIEKQRRTFSGQVIDLAGNPVIGADVYLKNYPHSKRNLHGISDDNGYFEIKLPAHQDSLRSPIVLWAILKDQPDFIAWTILRSEFHKERHKLGGPTPGSPGSIQVSDKYFVKKTEKGISYSGTWCVGATDIQLVMEPAGKIVGTVTDKQGLPVYKAQLQVEFELVDQWGNPEIYEHYLWKQRAETDENGYYEVGFLPQLWNKSMFTITARAGGLIQEKKTITTKGPLEEEKVDFQLHFSGPTVRGIVKDNYGTVLSERYIYAMVGNKWHWSCRTKTDAEGKYELRKCPDSPELKVRARLSHNSMPPHETEKHKNYVYYPDIIVPVNYEPDKMEYEAEMIAVLPELVIDVEVVDSAGNPIPDFPVDVRGKAGEISSQWKSDRKLQQRTDENGYIKFTQVPDIEGLHLVFWGGSGCWSDHRQSKEEKKRLDQIEREYAKYKWLEIPIEVIPGQKEYSIRAIVLTKEEAKKKQQN